VSKAKRLEELLLSLFTPEQLRGFLREGAQGNEILDALPGSSASMAMLVEVAAGELSRRGLVDKALFDRLCDARPGRAGDVRTTEAVQRATAGHSIVGAGVEDRISLRMFNLDAAQEWTVEMAMTDTLIQVGGALRVALASGPWNSPGIPRPGRGYRIQFYANEFDPQPLAPHTTVADLIGDADRRTLSLNVGWCRSFRGGPQQSCR
jgi:hypothetical protein